jgi:hypothetical protein
MLRFAARDGSILVFSLTLWWLLAERSAGSGWLADFAGVAVGVLFGVCAYVLHEWAHLLGALATRSRVGISHNLRSGFMFSYPAGGNSLAQFLVMSFSGFAATALVVWAYHAHLPDGLLATRVARGASLVLAFLNVTLEFPLVLLALRTRAVPGLAAVPIQDEPA